MPNIKVNIETQTIEIEQEVAPEVVLIDRGHHIMTYGDILHWEPDSPIPPEAAAARFSVETFRARRSKVDSLDVEQQLLIEIYESLEILRKLPWFNKLIKVIVEGSFNAKYKVELANRQYAIDNNLEDKSEDSTTESSSIELPDWNNTETYMLNYLAYFLKQIWPEFSSDLLNVPVKLDEISSTQLSLLNVDLSEADCFIEKYKSTIREQSIEMVNLLKQTLFSIFTIELYRTQLVGILYSAPMYIKTFFDFNYKARDAQLDYWEDTAGDLSAPIQDNWHFQQFNLIVEAARLALIDNPNDYIEFNIESGAICTSAGTEQTEFGRHCSRHSNSKDDYVYLMALEVIADRCPQYTNGIVIELHEDENIRSAKVALRLIANPTFIATVKSVRDQLWDIPDILGEA